MEVRHFKRDFEAQRQRFGLSRSRMSMLRKAVDQRAGERLIRSERRNEQSMVTGNR